MTIVCIFIVQGENKSTSFIIVRFGVAKKKKFRVGRAGQECCVISRAGVAIPVNEARPGKRYGFDTCVSRGHLGVN